MDIVFQTGGHKEWHADVAIVPVLEDEAIVATNSELDNACPWIAVAPAFRDIQTKKYAISMVHGHPQCAVSRVLFLGLGKKEDLTLDIVREGIAKAIKHIQKFSLQTLLIPLETLEKLPFGCQRLVQEIVYAAKLSLYRAGFLKKPSDDDPIEPKALAFGCTQENANLSLAVERGDTAAESTLLVRKLANTPANMLTPTLFAKKAQDIADQCGICCTVLDEEALKNEHMNAMLAVGAGSVHPPRLIVLEYAHEKHKEAKPLVLIGKGICFDSGGISLKPAAKMHEMKSDMSGAAAVLAAMMGIAKEKLPCRVIGICACAENLPDGKAVKPGDVVYAMNKDSVEIVNTDAEGRLVLCDAITYAREKFAPQSILDIATLTGACAVALGDQLAGLFCDDEEICEKILSAASVSGEYFWRMPLWKGYFKNLKSEIADICHTGPRTGGAITAALFLKHFADDTAFAHLDIAGVDWVEHASALCPKGASGFGARTLLEYVRGGLA